MVKTATSENGDRSKGDTKMATEMAIFKMATNPTTPTVLVKPM